MALHQCRVETLHQDNHRHQVPTRVPLEGHTGARIAMVTRLERRRRRHIGRDQVWPNPSLAKFGCQVWPDQVWQDQVWPGPSLAKTKFGQDQVRTINIVRVSVKVSPAEGRRRLHTNTSYARLSGFNRLSCEHRRPKAGDAPHEGLLKSIRRWLRRFGV